jgi:hypothetical protein
MTPDLRKRAIRALQDGVPNREIRKSLNLSVGQISHLRLISGLRKSEELVKRGRGAIDKPVSTEMHERLFDLSKFLEGVWHRIAEKHLDCWIPTPDAPMPADLVDEAVKARLLLTAVRYFGRPGAPDRRLVKVAILTSHGAVVRDKKWNTGL